MSVIRPRIMGRRLAWAVQQDPVSSSSRSNNDNCKMMYKYMGAQEHRVRLN